ncbi:PAS domain S-box protein [Reyranella sp. CPCC 100927]|uniref:PAS domain S-box protein n=1 Tax=Reyranella sp. CPCC 100927 TaxID=2599616 RepID=UPI0011B679C4|nr:PAS domain S-box protein [Reyranella sp. CPCC 100927]TWT11491.1 PAS domain S-box protein [Reyranella sp. CPCC 100927]
MSEAERLAALRRYDILDTGPEPQFDSIVELAARMFDAPAAAISFVDATRIWFKACYGVTVSTVPRNWNLYDEGVLADRVLVIRDLAHDPRFAGHPYAKIAHMHFYAVAPLHSRDGHCIGAVAVADHGPRPDLSDDRIAGLQALARLVEAELERRLLTVELEGSTERFRDLAKMSSDWMWETDIDHRITEIFNDRPNLARIAPTSIGRRRWDYPHARPLNGTWSEYRLMVEAHQEFRGFEYEVKTPAGDHHILRINGRPRFDAQGRFLGYRGTGSDVTAHRLAERELKDREQTFRFLFEKNPNPMYLFEHASLRILAANEAACSLYGYDRAEFETLTLYDLRPEPEKEMLRRRLAEADWTRRAQGRFRHQKKDGSVVEVFVNAEPARFNGVACDLVQVHDITQQLQAEARLAEAEATLHQKQKLEALGQLTGGIAHDFNNILAVVVGSIEIAADTIPPESAGHPPLAAAITACERGADLVARLLTFARRRPLEPREIAVGPLLEDIAGLVRAAVSPQVFISLSMADNLGVCHVDRSGLETAILNLAVNARDAMPDGGQLCMTAINRRFGTEDVRAHPVLKVGDWIEIAISDTGAGMASDVQAKVFEPFFTTKEEGKGTGLGLPMVHGFVHQSGGFLTLDTAPGRGTTFKLYLPALKRPAPQPAAEVPSPLAEELG